MKNPINILLLFVLLAACTSVPAGKGISYSDFPKTVKLEGQVIPLDTAVFRYPFRIRIEGGRAVVLDLHGADHFFQMFTYPHSIESFRQKACQPANRHAYHKRQDSFHRDK